MKSTVFIEKLEDLYPVTFVYIFEKIQRDYNREIKEGGFSGKFEEYLDEYATREEL